MKTTMTAGRSSENGGRFVGGHFAGGHDGMANLCKPITAYDFHVRYNNILCGRYGTGYISNIYGLQLPGVEERIWMLLTYKKDNELVFHPSIADFKTDTVITDFNPSDAEFTFFVKKRHHKHISQSSRLCHVGIHLKAVAEHYQMCANVPGFKPFFNFFSNYFVLSRSVTSSTMVYSLYIVETLFLSSDKMSFRGLLIFYP